MKEKRPMQERHRFRHSRPLITRLAPAMAWLLLFDATPALAIQAHGAPEGLYVHEIGHILYGLAMLGFTLRVLRSTRLSRKPGWRLMSRGTLLLFLWNIWAFIAHIIDAAIPASHFLTDSGGLQSILVLRSGIDYLYCLFRMDHLLCVPALLLIYLGLRHMVASAPITPEEQVSSR
ncbi:hypothetical protein ACLG6S_00445 [Thermodesulfobacteriota bacterium B35]